MSEKFLQLPLYSNEINFPRVYNYAMYELECFKTSSGTISARVHINNEITRHLHSTVEPCAEKTFYQNLPIFGNTLVLSGCGVGHHIPGFLNKIACDATIILVDFFAELTSFCKQTYFKNHTGCIYEINAENVSATNAYPLLNNHNSIQIIRHPASVACNPEFYNSIVTKLLSKNATTRVQQTTSVGPPLILFGSFFLQEEIKRAVAQIYKKDPICFRYPSHTLAQSYEAHLQKLVETEYPRYIFSVNMKGFDGNGFLPRYAKQKGIPLVIWFVDDPRPILLHQKQFITNSCTAVCWEKSYLPYLKTCGFEKVSYLPLATDPTLLTFQPSTNHAIPLGFVGTPMSGSFLTNIKNEFLYKKELEPIVAESAHELLQNRKSDVHALLALYAQKYCVPLFTDTRNATWLATLTIHTASMLKRKAVIQALIPQGIETFGDPAEWHNLVGTNLIAHPSLVYGKDLNNVYSQTAINVNITSCQMPCAVNQRVFDAPASGGFLLTDNQSDLQELFSDSDNEVALYTGTEELIDKVDYYTKNPHMRHTLVCAAHKRILSCHTYAHRIAELEKILFC